jgi:hypothetical protein
VIGKGIDPARIGLSKSLMTNPCERKGAYSELVRDDQGRRLQFPMPERVLFGRFIDAMHSYIVWKDMHGKEWTEAEAFRLGLENAHDTEASEDIDWGTFGVQAYNAITLFLEQDEGLAKMRECYPRNLQMQGANGTSLRHGDIVGTPDYGDDLGPIDVKATGKSFSPSKFYTSAEMPVYALLWSVQHGGEIPQRLAYQTYVRTIRPSWKWLEVPGAAGHIALGQLHANRWRKGLAHGDPDLFAFNTSFCGDCPWREAIEAVGHPGCPIVQAVPVVEEEAA